LAPDAIGGPVMPAIAAISFAPIALMRIDSLWVMLGAAAIGLLSFQF
jgi:hypothetical protein